MPKRAGVIWTHEKPSCFSQTPFRAERDARMSEMVELKRKLARIGDRGCKVPVYVAQNIIFPTSMFYSPLSHSLMGIALHSQGEVTRVLVLCLKLE